MKHIIEYFEKNSYVITKDVLSKEECKNLTEYMFSLYKQGNLVKDEQCPLSDSIYGNIVFDNLLKNLAKPIGNMIGRDLLPTYTYARIYRNGEILKKHKDRPACEISATLTLGYNAEQIWPIFFDEDNEVSVELNIGEMAIYKGCDIVHWRPKFKGEWHVQLFLHYVDANGPYKDEFMDKRKELGTEKTVDENNLTRGENIKISNPIFNGVIIPNSDNNFFPGYFCIDSFNLPQLKFSKEECSKIINLAKGRYHVSAGVGSNSNRQINKSIRHANIYDIENNLDNKWIYEKISNITSIINTIHFKYDIVGITHNLQLLEYITDDNGNGHYNWHVDCGNGEASTRKISIIVQLSNEKEYDGCNLIINNTDEIKITREQGSVHLFPSFTLHKVSDITRGVRYSLVIWIHGSSRFR